MTSHENQPPKKTHIHSPTSKSGTNNSASHSIWVLRLICFCSVSSRNRHFVYRNCIKDYTTGPGDFRDVHLDQEILDMSIFCCYWCQFTIPNNPLSMEITSWEVVVVAAAGVVVVVDVVVVVVVVVVVGGGGGGGGGGVGVGVGGVGGVYARWYLY